MQEENILLSDLGDEDLFVVGDKFYKVVKLKNAFNRIYESLGYILGNTSYNKYGSSNLGLLVHNKHYGRHGAFCLPKEFMQNGFSYKFIKLGYPGWQSGLFKLSMTTYLISGETEEKVLLPYYDFSGINFCAEGVTKTSKT